MDSGTSGVGRALDGEGTGRFRLPGHGLCGSVRPGPSRYPFRVTLYITVPCGGTDELMAPVEVTVVLDQRSLTV